MVRAYDKCSRLSASTTSFSSRLSCGPASTNCSTKSRQALRKNRVRRLRVLMLVEMEQLQDEGQSMEGVLLGARLLGGGLAALDFLVQGQQLRRLLAGSAGFCS